MTRIPKPTATTRTQRHSKRHVKPEQRHLWIREAAYYRAESDDFRKDAVEYWLAAEEEVGRG